MKKLMIECLMVLLLTGCAVQERYVEMLVKERVKDMYAAPYPAKEKPMQLTHIQASRIINYQRSNVEQWAYQWAAACDANAASLCEVWGRTDEEANEQLKLFEKEK